MLVAAVPAYAITGSFESTGGQNQAGSFGAYEEHDLDRIF